MQSPPPPSGPRPDALALHLTFPLPSPYWHLIRIWSAGNLPSHTEESDQSNRILRPSSPARYHRPDRKLIFRKPAPLHASKSCCCNPASRSCFNSYKCDELSTRTVKIPRLNPSGAQCSLNISGTSTPQLSAILPKF